MNKLSNINIGDELLGSGSYASVFKGTMLHNGKWRDVAVKKIPNDGDHYTASAQKEYDVLSHLKSHENIIQLLDMKTDRSYIYVIMEFAALGDLERYIKNNTPDLEQKIKIMLETASGIKYIHSLRPPVILRDIKPGNILIQSSRQGAIAKICDFGLARIFDAEGTSVFMSTDVGTPMYRAPEQFKKGSKHAQYTSAVDVFSLGLVYMGLLNVSRYNHQVECLPESLLECDLLPYAQHLMEARRHKTPMPAIFTCFTLTSENEWPETELKFVIAHMVAFEAANRKKIEDVENSLQTIFSTYSRNKSSAASQPGNLVNRKDEEIFELNALLADVLKEKEDMQKKYEQRIREMEEQVALANQQKSGPPTSKPTLRMSSNDKGIQEVKNKSEDPAENVIPVLQQTPGTCAKVKFHSMDIVINDFRKRSRDHAQYLETVLKQAQEKSAKEQVNKRLQSQINGFTNFCAEFTPRLRRFGEEDTIETIKASRTTLQQHKQTITEYYITAIEGVEVFAKYVKDKNKLTRNIEDVKKGLTSLTKPRNTKALFSFCRDLPATDQAAYSLHQKSNSDMSEISSVSDRGANKPTSQQKKEERVKKENANHQGISSNRRPPSAKQRPLPCVNCHKKEQELLDIRDNLDKIAKQNSKQLEDANNALKEQEKKDKEYQLKESEDRNRDLTSQIRDMEREIAQQSSKIDQLSYSLAEEMGNKVGADESSIENVSIKNRPMNVADDYSNFCTNAWLDAKDVLDEKFKTKYNEKDMIMFLLDVLQISYHEVRKNVNLAVDYARKVGVITIHQILSSPLPLPPDIGKLKLDAVKADTKIPADGKDFVNYNAMGDFLRIHAEKRDRKELYEHIKKEIKKECDTMPGKRKSMYVDFYKVLTSNNSGTVYIKESIDLSYKMAIPRPPMEFSLEGIGRPWNEKTQDLNWGTKKEPNSVVDLYVHPVLLHGGKLMTKGKVALWVKMEK